MPLVLLAVLLLFEAEPPTGAAMVLPVALVLLVLLLVEASVAEALPATEADLEALASSEELEVFDPVVDRAP